MSSPALQMWLTEHLIRRVELAAVETLFPDGPILPHDVRQITKARAYVRQLREDPRLEGVRDLYACLRQDQAATVVLADGREVSLRSVWKRVRRHMFALPSHTFGMLRQQAQINWVSAHIRAGKLLEGAAETEIEAPRMEWLYTQAAMFYGAAAVWLREQARNGMLSLDDLDEDTQHKLSELRKYVPWLPSRLAPARTTGEAEETRQSAENRRRHEQNLMLMPASLRQFFQGGASR
jgi:hypothetical protein